MKRQSITIEETEHVVDDHFFDFIGNEFKDHVKGLAEWLKNSVDAYIDKGTPANEQVVVLRFTDEKVHNPTIECIDFVGMDHVNIEKALKRWGDPTAAKRGKDIKTYGGHGNGGKFYMRQAFSESRFITYKGGLLNIFGFSKNKKYGFATGYEKKKMTPNEALSFARINTLPIPQVIKDNIINSKTGFTVVLGIDPVGIRKKIKLQKVIERLKNFPQSRRILQQINTSVVYNDYSLYALLKPEELKPKEKFEEPRIITVPDIIEVGSAQRKMTIKLANEKYPQGQLVLRTSDEALSKGSKLGELNRIDILGEIGVIASYRLYEMDVKGWPQAAFIYGECQVPILENPDYDCVSNDRTRLVKNEATEALVDWIAQEIDKLATEISEYEKEKLKVNQKEISTKFNDVLNQWKNQHMKKIMSEIFEGTGGLLSDDGNSGFVGTQVTVPPSGFDFKYPEAEIPLNADSKATLKVSVPESLPIGATIFLSFDKEVVATDFDKYYIKSDYLKSAPNGQEVAFINIGLTGLKLGAETILTATAGKLSASMKLKVAEVKGGGKGKSFPRVLQSGFDQDPLDIAPGGILHLSERESLVYQRPQDVAESIYWINTSSPLASLIYDRFTSESIQWRNFLFERYVDIFVKEAIHELHKKDYQNFNADTVDQKIADVIKKVHQNARIDLDQFLFDTSYKV